MLRNDTVLDTVKRTEWHKGRSLQAPKGPVLEVSPTKTQQNGLKCVNYYVLRGWNDFRKNGPLVALLTFSLNVFYAV